jgi:hypothetical protein
MHYHGDLLAGFIHLILLEVFIVLIFSLFTSILVLFDKCLSLVLSVLDFIRLLFKSLVRLISLRSVVFVFASSFLNLFSI